MVPKPDGHQAGQCSLEGMGALHRVFLGIWAEDQAPVLRAGMWEPKVRGVEDFLGPPVQLCALIRSTIPRISQPPTWVLPPSQGKDQTLLHAVK